MPNLKRERMAAAESDKREQTPVIQENVNLRPYNTLSIEAVADLFTEVRHKDELEILFRNGFFQKHDPFILGGGSNILFRDNPARAILKNSIGGIETVYEDDSAIQICAGAGVVWHDLVKYAVQSGLGGIENLALIPGTTGAAPIQNIGAYGVELEQVFSSLEYFDTERGKFVTLSHNDCRFGYRDSIFKHELKNKAVVTSVTLQLTKNNHRLNTEYYALREWLKEKGITNPGIPDLFEAVVDIRRSKLPDPEDIGNAGSFFKNPVLDQNTFERLQKEYPDVPSFETDDGRVKVPAGWLIEQCGWKGKKVGNAGTYRNQALVIVNFGSATGEEIFELSKKIQESVKQKFGIGLMPEVTIVD
ncbi:MAG: UDP-N-acetylmuramate dehydrogenase [Balneolaceae bacterium]|nr:UDP-N-acetylmuramate dehydrogenase [Balneolaceae bacterium]